MQILVSSIRINNNISMDKYDDNHYHDNDDEITLMIRIVTTVRRHPSVSNVANFKIISTKN